jgi:hypothetical protein
LELTDKNKGMKALDIVGIVEIIARIKKNQYSPDS